ncbi:MAG: hypothetical protein ACYDCN_01010 [Bacteroidia bacterium]
MLKVKINISVWFCILFLNTTVVFSQQKDSILSIPQTFNSDSIKKDSIYTIIITPDSTTRLASDSSANKNNKVKNTAGDSSKLVSDSSKYKGLLNKLLPTGLIKSSPDSSTKGNLLNKIVPTKNAKLPSDRSANKNLLSKILPLGITKSLPDSNTKKTFFKNFIQTTHGNITAGYDYGVIPFAANTKYPTGYFNSQGNLSFIALGIPLIATYYYSTLKNVAGLNNYFRISFDATRYKEMMRGNGVAKVDEETKKLNILTSLKQTLLQKLAFSEAYKNTLPPEKSLTDGFVKYKNGYNDINTDSLMRENSKITFDTSLTQNQKDSLTKSKPSSIMKSAYTDSIQRVLSHLYKSDSTSYEINQYTKQLKKIDQEMNSIQNKLDNFQNPQTLAENNPYLKKYQSVLTGIKKFDVGLCYPNYSTFLVSGSTVKGINIEWEKKFYFAATLGKTINTVMTTNNVIQNQLQTGRNLYNYFDFNNVKDSRKIAAMKFGIGKKEASHLYVGFLYGVGLPSYISASPQTTLEKNLVLEIDGRIVLDKSNTLDVIYGKSALYQQDGSVVLNSENSGSHYLFSKYRSNGGLVRFTSQIKKTKTKIIATGKMVDPFFNSYGVGFMRSDNIRYEIKVEQEITPKIKFSGFYRKDRDNILNTFTYTTDLQTFGATLNVKVNKRLTAKASYMPVIQNIVSKDSGAQNIHHINNITTAVITYAPKSKKFNSFINVVYSNYQLSGTNGKSNNFQNYNVNNTTIINQHFKTNLALNYFLNNDNDSLNNSTTLFSGDVSYITNKGMTIMLGGKYAYNNLIKEQIGGLLKINIPIISHIHLEVYGEKLVLGDFYNSYNMIDIKRFPFYCYGKMVINW